MGISSSYTISGKDTQVPVSVGTAPSLALGTQIFTAKWIAPSILGRTTALPPCNCGAEVWGKLQSRSCDMETRACTVLSTSLHPSGSFPMHGMPRGLLPILHPARPTPPSLSLSQNHSNTSGPFLLMCLKPLPHASPAHWLPGRSSEPAGTPVLWDASSPGIMSQ